MSSFKSKKFAESFFASTSRIDKSNLREVFDSWPSVAKTSWDESQPPQLERTYSSIVFVGMGGSGIVGDIIADLASEQESYRVDVLKDYHLPRYYTSDTLVMGLSSSGDTEETVSVLNEAAKKGFDICTFGSGGMLEKMSLSNNRIKFTKTRLLKVPRTSFPALFYPVLKFLVQNGFLKVSEDHVTDSINGLSRVHELVSKPVVKQNKAFEIALEFSSKGAMPLIYSSRRTRGTGIRFRQSLNENAKLHAYNGVIPELCHNEIVAWDYAKTAKVKKSFVSNAVPIALRLEDDPIEIRTRFQIIEEILRKAKSQFIQVPSIGTSYLSRIISMLYLLDYSTYFTAIIRGVDPILTPSIDLLKSELKTRLNYLGRTS
jgi:glucose/mannose-6-phosphate isomerase